MCGITALFSRAPTPRLAETILNMTAVLAARGPDDEGYILGDFRDGSFASASGLDTVEAIKDHVVEVLSLRDHSHTVGLGHRRLAIIDPSPAGHQPMVSEHDDLCIVFNGEIYNFKEIREELKIYGYRFRSNTDTEVLLGAYRQFGAGMLQKLNGIFGFAIWDVKKRMLLAARDHFGVKPVYYAFDDTRFMLASEIKALIQADGFNRSLDLRSLDDFLTFRYTPSPNTLFTGIKRLAPGHALRFDPINWQLETFRYYAPSPRIQEGWTLEEWQEAYSEAVARAVRRQLISDVPLGILLSGGVDSGLVTAIAASMVSSKVKTFTVGFTGEHAANEIAEARETSALLGTDHAEVLGGPR